MSSAAVNDFGLILDIFGAGLLFIYGIAPKIDRQGSQTLQVGSSISEMLKARSYDLKARIGVSMIFLGFIFQLLSNHIDSPFVKKYGTVIIILAASTTLVVAGLYFWKKFKSRITLIGQHIPQFDYDQKNRNFDHLWQFDLTNNTNKVLLDAELQLPYKVKRIDLLLTRRAPVHFEETDSTVLEKLGPYQTATFRVWNMGSGGGTGDDTYVRIGKRMIGPKILNSIPQD